ncbi:cell adhesion molecule 3-like isoform X2 [Patiria miniata]|uniref:Ig-like domain-containing protein n=1 Tax=Patiria miniata TaxID=46514 RepID=A0A914ARG8_PATMI|nr:cell adhesion molecule 3-like isoform X2 [Patiria miniata]
MVVIGSTAIIETEQSQACVKLTQNSPIFVQDFKRCLGSTAAAQGAPGMPWFNSMDAQVILSKFVGDTATLKCTVEDKGNRDVAWLRTEPHSNIIFTRDEMYDSDPRYKIDTDNNRTFHLRIERLTRADNGTYACTVNTKPVISWNVTLQIVAPATVTDIVQMSQGVSDSGKRTFFFNESDTVELKCNGDGSPQARLAWIGPAGDQVGNSTLRIDGIQRSQYGEYRCEADNGFNDIPDARLVTLKVNYKPEIRVYQTDIEIRKAVGEYVKMLCRADASPRATYTWRKDGVLVPPASRINNRQTILVIVSIQPEHYGVYTCEATNLLGTSRANITLNGKPLPPIIVSDPVGTRRHIFKLMWQHQSKQPPNYPGTIPVTYYKILYRGWWRQSTQDRRKVYSLEDETNLMEEIAYPDFSKIKQFCNLHDLRHNATYDLQLYAVNDQGDSDPVNFTFYTALEDEVTTSNGDTAGPLSLSSINENQDPNREGLKWTAPSIAPSSAPSTATVLAMVIALALGLHCTEVYK